jgi:hypothetical protein
LTSFGRAAPPPLLELHAEIASMLRATKIGMVLLGFIGHLWFSISYISKLTDYPFASAKAMPPVFKIQKY